MFFEKYLSSKSNSKKIIIKGTLILTVASLVNRGIGFLYRIFLSNLIGAKGMGIYQLIFPVLAFCVSLSCGGIQIAVSRFVAESKSKKDRASVLFSSIIMSLVLSVTTSVVLYFGAFVIAEYIVKNNECGILLRLASFTIPLTAMHSCVAGFYLGQKKTFIPSVTNIIEQTVKVIAIYIIGMVCISSGIELTPKVAVYSMLISEFIGVLFCFIFLSQEKFERTSFKKIYSSFKNLFSVSYVLTVNKVMLTFLQCAEAVMVPIFLRKSGMSNDAALSTYGILMGMALPVITFPSALNSSVSTMILPTIAKANSSDNSTGIKKTTKFSIWFSTVMGIFFIGFFMFYGDFIGRRIFGHAHAGTYIQALSFLCPFMYLSITLGSVLHGLGNTRTAFIHNVCGVLIRILSLIFLVPHIGIKGYLWGLLFSEIITTTLHFMYVKKHIKIDFSPRNCIIKPAVWLGLSLAASYLIKYIFSFCVYKNIIFDYAIQCACALCIIAMFAFFLINDLRQA